MKLILGGCSMTVAGIVDAFQIIKYEKLTLLLCPLYIHLPFVTDSSSPSSGLTPSRYPLLLIQTLISCQLPSVDTTRPSHSKITTSGTKCTRDPEISSLFSPSLPYPFSPPFSGSFKSLVYPNYF